MSERVIRLGLPTKGRMEQETFAFLDSCGLHVVKPNPRQYVASIPAIPEIEVWLQRSPDIVRKVHHGDVDLGVTGYDSVAEHGYEDDTIVVLHDELGFGRCCLTLAVPDEWADVESVTDLVALARRRAEKGQPLRVGSKYQQTVTAFLNERGIVPHQLISAEGALEAGPHMGYVDLIADLTASGATLRENHLKQIEGGTLLTSQACLIGNRRALKQRADVLVVAKQLLEFFEAHLRAMGYHAIIANIKGDSPEAVAEKVFSQPDLGGLQGPTVSRICLRDAADHSWYAISIIVRQQRLVQAVQQLRTIGGSGVVVMPAMYIFEDEPAAYRKLVAALEEQTE